jgi:hypothetical protein
MCAWAGRTHVSMDYIPVMSCDHTSVTRLGMYMHECVCVCAYICMFKRVSAQECAYYTQCSVCMCMRVYGIF